MWEKCTSYLKELLEIKEYCHADNVIIAGEITNEERNWMYAHSEAFLFPSRLEGFGLPVLEAMRYNCKVSLLDTPAYQKSARTTQPTLTLLSQKKWLIL